MLHRQAANRTETTWQPVKVLDNMFSCMWSEVYSYEDATVPAHAHAHCIEGSTLVVQQLAEGRSLVSSLKLEPKPMLKLLQMTGVTCVLSGKRMSTCLYQLNRTPLAQLANHCTSCEEQNYVMR